MATDNTARVSTLYTTMNKQNKPSPKRATPWALVIIGAVLFIFVFAVYIVLSKLAIFERTYSKKDLIENLNAKQAELAEVETYVNSIVPKDREIKIEFGGRRTLPIFHLTDKRATSAERKYDQNWNLKIGDEKTQALLKRLGWTEETLITLQEKLSRANCISVESGEPFTIGYQRSGMGMYFYKVFKHTLTATEMGRYNDGCHYLYYQDNIVLEYGGGAIGPQCFPKSDK